MNSKYPEALRLALIELRDTATRFGKSHNTFIPVLYLTRDIEAATRQAINEQLKKTTGS